jgi:hypothetical protein
MIVDSSPPSRSFLSWRRVVAYPRKAPLAVKAAAMAARGVLFALLALLSRRIVVSAPTFSAPNALRESLAAVAASDCAVTARWITKATQNTVISHSSGGNP